MATISENLQTIKDSTDAIKQAIIDKGGTISGDITTWASAISGISGEGELPTSNLILNKLNGASIGDPNVYYDLKTVLYTYNFNAGNCLDVILTPLSQFGFVRMFLEDIEHIWWPDNSHRFSLFSEGMFTGSVNIENNILSELNLVIEHWGDSLYNDAHEYKYMIIAMGIDGSFDTDTFTLNVAGAICYIKDTNISLNSGLTKKVQDIDYNDELLVWNFDECRYDKAKPLWIKKEEITDSYYEITLDNGDTIGLVGSNGRCHRLFNYDDMMFESATELVGKNVHTLTGIHKVVSVENIKETVEYYNIITNYHMNCFANGMLTSCRYNNLYPIKNMKFDKSNVVLEPTWKIHQEKFKPNPEILPKYIRGMRLDENTTMSVDEMKKYIIKLENTRKTLLDFNEDKLLKKIEDTEVGWIDREGNAYGFKTYMTGQYNHIILADKICKELNIETDNTSRYLDKEGWLKYTTNFVINSDDKIVTKKQLETLKVFLKHPNKLQNEGKIRIGIYNSPLVDIAEFENMDEYSFEYRKQLNLKNSIYEYKKN